jgi:proteasome accessory factor A
MSEYATFLKVGATSCILRMLEEPNVVLRDMTLENPIRAIREISHDITCTRKVRLANGREVSALDIQSEYLQRALRYAETRLLSPEEKQALERGSTPSPPSRPTRSRSTARSTG